MPTKAKVGAALCDICGRRGVTVRRVTRGYGKGPRLLVVENVPVASCSRCGESYLTADTLHEIDRIKLLRRSLAIARNVPVASFG